MTTHAPIPGIAAAWAHHRDLLADALGRLRRRLEPDSYDRLLVDRAAGELDALDILLEPTAADLVRIGFGVGEALAMVDRHADELHRRLGGRP